MSRFNLLHLGIVCGVLAGGQTTTAAQEPCSAAATAGSSLMSSDRDIVQVASAAGNFSTLLAAVKAAGLVDALKAEGPLTVFAPTDAAFAKLPGGTVESLLRPENKTRLISILTYHVVPARLTAADVTKTSGVLTLQGQRISFKISGDNVVVDGATVVAADVQAQNGVIHAIDNVILPTEKSCVEVAASTGSFSTLLAAAKAAGLAETLATGGPFTIFAPRDAAFAKLPKGTVDGLLQPENREKLANILKLHVVAGRLDSTGAAKAGHATSLQGGRLAFVSHDGGLSVNGARIVSADMNAANGLIHVIDTVILPN